ncbi:hypothetical protein [Pyrococcus sp. ST04]|uniref:hypothetical protein n=1 Tax=Pyrococcus sp. ST04 TaxID=1183377 RepID=UPI000B0E41CD|nr:hypothetical protein [Pyrococcus sp. ST04]
MITALFTPGKTLISTPLGDITKEGVHNYFLLLGKAYLSSSMAVVLTSSPP